MNAKNTTTLNKALELITEVRDSLQELSDMEQAEELHGQEIDPDVNEQIEALEVVMDDLNSLT